MSATRVSDVFLDSLPYIDQEIEYEGMREKVDKLVEQEMKRTPRRDLAQFPSNFELFKNSPVLSSYYQRIQQGKTKSDLDTARYTLPTPTNTKDIEEWRKAVDNSKAQLEHSNFRSVNIALIQKYGANAWRTHNYQLEGELQRMQLALEQYRTEILEVNKQRKAQQLQAGRQLHALEQKWTELIGHTIQVEVACATLAKELEQLNLYEEQLKNELGMSNLEIKGDNTDDGNDKEEME